MSNPQTQAYEDTRARTGRAVATARERLDGAGEVLRKKAAKAAGLAQERAAEGVTRGRQTAAAALGDFVAAIRQGQQELTRRGRPGAARLAGRAASSLEGFAPPHAASSSLLGAGLSRPGLLRSVGRVGLSKPVLLAGAVVLAGVVVSRLARKAAVAGEAVAKTASLPDETGLADETGGETPWPTDETPSFAGAGDELEVSGPESARADQVEDPLTGVGGTLDDGIARRLN